MTPEKIAAEIVKINVMSRLEMCRLWRFAPSGHIYFDRAYLCGLSLRSSSKSWAAFHQKYPNNWSDEHA